MIRAHALCPRPVAAPRSRHPARQPQTEQRRQHHRGQLHQQRHGQRVPHARARDQGEEQRAERGHPQGQRGLLAGAVDPSPGAESFAEFREIWARHEVVGAGSRTKIFRNAHVGLLRLEHTDLWLGPSSGPRMVTYAPADEETRERLERLQALELADV